MLKTSKARVYSRPDGVPPVQGVAMPVRSRVKVLLYQQNAKRVAAGEKPITVRGLAREAGIAYSALRKLVDNESTRVDFDTLDKLMQFFGTRDLNDILE